MIYTRGYEVRDRLQRSADNLCDRERQLQQLITFQQLITEEVPRWFAMPCFPCCS